MTHQSIKRLIRGIVAHWNSLPLIISKENRAVIKLKTWLKAVKIYSNIRVKIHLPMQTMRPLGDNRLMGVTPRQQQTSALLLKLNEPIQMRLNWTILKDWRCKSPKIINSLMMMITISLTTSSNDPSCLNSISRMAWSSHEHQMPHHQYHHHSRMIGNSCSRATRLWTLPGYLPIMIIKLILLALMTLISSVSRQAW